MTCEAVTTQYKNTKTNTVTFRHQDNLINLQDQ